MGVFSFLFGSKDKTYQVNNLGTFTYDGEYRKIHTWVIDLKGASVSIKGNSEEPNSRHIEFVKKLDETLFNLREDINTALVKLFQDAGLQVNFKSWEEVFELRMLDLDELNPINKWEISLSRKGVDEISFSFYIEDNKMVKASMDT